MELRVVGLFPNLALKKKKKKNPFVKFKIKLKKKKNPPTSLRSLRIKAGSAAAFPPVFCGMWRSGHAAGWSACCGVLAGCERRCQKL